MNPYASFQFSDALKPVLSETPAAQAARQQWLRSYEQMQQSWMRSVRDLFGHCDALLRESESLQDTVLDRYSDWLRGWTGTAEDETAAADGAAREVSVAPAAAGPAVPLEDDLTRIQGVGRIVQQRLKGVGVVSFHQIATWTDTEIAYIENNVLGRSYSGRVSREGWQVQAKELLKES